MKICVTTNSGSLDAAVEPRFGRCAYFVIVDPETMEFETLENPAHSAAGGAGIQAAQTLANKGIDVLLTGDVGPNAFPILSNAGIKVVTGTTGTVKEAVDRYKKGPQEEAGYPASPTYTRMGRGRRYFYGSPRMGGRGYGRFAYGRGFCCRWHPHPLSYCMPEPYIPCEIPSPYEIPATELSRDEEIYQIEEMIGSLEDEIKDLKEKLKEISKDNK